MISLFIVKRVLAAALIFSISSVYAQAKWSQDEVSRNQDKVPRRTAKAPSRSLKKSKALKISKSSKSSKSTKSPKYNLYNLGVINLEFNPAFLSFDEFEETSALFISSFFNAKFGLDSGPPKLEFFAPDLVAKMTLNKSRSFLESEVTAPEILSETISIPPKTVWPNEVNIAPDGVFPFAALLVPQGFFTSPFPGRLTAIDMATKMEYIIDQSSNDTANFYHNAVYHDIDGDGLLDIISVRSGFRWIPFQPPTGELVWFKNPGEGLDKDVGWEQGVLVPSPVVPGFGPDIHVMKHDFDGDGVPEFLTTHFFTEEKITIHGVSNNGKNWSDVIMGDSEIKSVVISTDQGRPFGIDISDLDGDGQVDILATNHVEDNCTFPSDFPGKVYAMVPPKKRDDFYNAAKWNIRILLDGIYPQPSLEGAQASRLAPGGPLTRSESAGGRPWIVVSGDEAGKVWLFRPSGKKGWKYDIKVIFDINDTYGQNTTQTEHPEKPLITISTIGLPAIRYDREGEDGMTEIYIPVFEGQDIHVFSFRKPDGVDAIDFLEDIQVQCPVQN